MGSVKAFVVHRAVETAELGTPASERHAHFPNKTLAQHNCTVDKPFAARGVGLAQLRVIFPTAMCEGHPLTFSIESVHVMLLVLL